MPEQNPVLTKLSIRQCDIHHVWHQHDEKPGGTYEP